LRKDDKDRRLEETLYHVMLAGQKLGPFDRRTIVGMRVRKTLTSKDVLESSDGRRLSVAQLVRQTPAEPPPSEPAFAPPGRSSYSVIQAVHTADLLEVRGSGYPVPPFKGELEVRVQTKVLRISGRFREGLDLKEDRVKFPLVDIIHARLQGNVVDLGVRPPSGDGLQRLRLTLRTRESAGELVEALPHTVPWPGSEPLAGRSGRATRMRKLPAWAMVTALGTAGAVAGWMLLYGL
jgi:hypothetical protein